MANASVLDPSNRNLIHVDLHNNWLNMVHPLGINTLYKMVAPRDDMWTEFGIQLRQQLLFMHMV